MMGADIFLWEFVGAGIGFLVGGILTRYWDGRYERRIRTADPKKIQAMYEKAFQNWDKIIRGK
jgi:hypothetical protein